MQVQSGKILRCREKRATCLSFSETEKRSEEMTSRKEEAITSRLTGWENGHEAVHMSQGRNAPHPTPEGGGARRLRSDGRDGISSG